MFIRVISFNLDIYSTGVHFLRHKIATKTSVSIRHLSRYLAVHYLEVYLPGKLDGGAEGDLAE